ncbi:trigger factor [Pedosphaera parvula]|uniref:Trigger factor n=1 Tax=Pedosphaera parvula (strain Ellin514) TaxID=320771 RepID=B9XKB4_PEDPL|nr:trigger factor [Pedosphaera parvula]EEF59752.1 trigger factor [Pedosphaera parvula Ellin514]
MNVTVENLAPCKKLVRVEVESPEVDKAFDSMIKDFQRQAALPGFRPGKAPRDMVVKRYEKDIQDEVKRKLIPDAYRKAIEEQKLEVVGAPDIEEIQFSRGQALQFAATIETAPEFELPEYKGIPAKRETTQVTDADVERAINMLRERQTNFNTVERAAQAGDVAVVNYTGTTDGKPLTEVAPTAKGLTEQKGFWINIDKNSFIPGFADQLIGAKAGDKRTVNVDFPADFVTPQLANKKGVYEVEVVEVKEKILPAVDDAFAKTYGAESLEKLREGVRKDLENELTYKKTRSVRNQLVEELLKRVSFELPESSVNNETRNVVYNIVQENQQRGIPKEVIEQQKDQIYSAANDSAKTRVKAAFIFQKIAEKEGIKVSQEEVAQRVHQMASTYQVPVEKFVKDLQQRNGIVEIYDQIANEKVLDFVQQNAKIEDVAPEPAPAANPA